MENNVKSKIQSSQIIFICGVGRSGTSLLQSMFAAHPDVACLPETSFLRRFVAHGKLQGLYENQGEQAAVQAIKADEHFGRTGLDAANIVSKAIARGGLLDVAVYLEMLTAYSGDKTLVGDKDPRSVEYLSLLKAVLPDAHVIHIFRDPRDVLASKKKAEWSKNGHIWKHVFANRVQVRIGSRLGPKLFGRNYHEISYEALLSNSEKVLSGLCRDMGIEYDKEMLSFGKAAKTLVSEKEMSWKKETLGPLLTKNRNKWRTDLSPREVVLTQMCCKAALDRRGYQKDQRRHQLCLKDRFWIQLGRLVIIMATWPYMKYREFRNRQACRRMQ